MKEFEIIWSNQAKNSVKEIYEFFKEKPLAVAKKPSIFLNNISPMILTQSIEG